MGATFSDPTFAIRLLEHLVVPTFVLDAQGRVLIWNSACQRLTGISPAEVIGTAEHWRAFYEKPRPCLADLVLQGHTGDTSGLYAEITMPETNSRGLRAENWCVMPRLASRRYLAIDAGPIYSDTGDLLAVVETLRDITVQREAQVALQALAHVDGLTGLPNRRTFDEALDREFRQARRTCQPISLMLIDIDHFKKFNDTAGHQAGDECLRRVARAIKGQMYRPGDQAARYGGEEFAVIMPNTNQDGALIVADRILTAVTVEGIQHPAPDAGGKLTVSIGLACAEPQETSSADHLLRRSDAALYEAKRRGRNMVVVYSSEHEAKPTLPLAKTHLISRRARRGTASGAQA